MKNHVATALLITLSVLTFSQAKISFDVMSHDFGYVSEGKKVNYTFEFSNTGNDTLKLEKVQPSCGCTSPYWSREPVLPGKKGKIEVVYNSKKRLGEFSKSIQVKSNAVNKTSALKISGVVAAPIQKVSLDSIAKSAKVNFNSKTIQVGRLERLSKYAFTIDLGNVGQAPLKVQRISSGCHCVTTQEVIEIRKGETKKIKLTFKGTESRLYDEKVLIQVNDPMQPYLEFNLKGIVINSLRQENMMQTNPGSGF